MIQIQVMALFQYIIYAFVIGVGGVILFMYIRRRYLHNRLKCFFYTRSREIIEARLRPNANNLLLFREGFYAFDRRFVKLYSDLVGGRTPSLTFVEDNPIPVIVENYAPGEVEFTAKQIKSDIEDAAWRMIGQSANEESIETFRKKISQLVVIAMAVTVLIVMIGFYWTNGQQKKKFEEFAILAGWATPAPQATRGR